jgi:hypothetical protein
VQGCPDPQAGYRPVDLEDPLIMEITMHIFPTLISRVDAVLSPVGSQAMEDSLDLVQRGALPLVVPEAGRWDTQQVMIQVSPSVQVLWPPTTGFSSMDAQEKLMCIVYRTRTGIRDTVV